MCLWIVEVCSDFASNEWFDNKTSSFVMNFELKTQNWFSDSPAFKQSLRRPKASTVNSKTWTCSCTNRIYAKTVLTNTMRVERVRYYHRNVSSHSKLSGIFDFLRRFLPKQVLDTEKPRSLNSRLTRISRLHFYEHFLLAAQIRRMRFVWNCLHALNRLFDAIVSLIRKHEAIWISRNNFHNFMHTQPKPCVTTSKCRFCYCRLFRNEDAPGCVKTRRDASRVKARLCLKKVFRWKAKHIGIRYLTKQ